VESLRRQSLNATRDSNAVRSFLAYPDKVDVLVPNWYQNMRSVPTPKRLCDLCVQTPCLRSRSSVVLAGSRWGKQMAGRLVCGLRCILSRTAWMERKNQSKM